MTDTYTIILHKGQPTAQCDGQWIPYSEAYQKVQRAIKVGIAALVSETGGVMTYRINRAVPQHTGRTNSHRALAQ